MPGLAEVANVPRSIAAVIGAGKATMVELQTALGVEDLYDLMEIMAVDSHNRRRAEQHARGKER